MITVPFSLSSVPFHLAIVCYVCYMSILSHQTKRKGLVSQDFNLFILRIPICHFFFSFFLMSVPEFLRMYSFDSICTSVAIESYYITNNIHVYSKTCVFTISIIMTL